MNAAVLWTICESQWVPVSVALNEIGQIDTQGVWFENDNVLRLDINFRKEVAEKLYFPKTDRTLGRGLELSWLHIGAVFEEIRNGYPLHLP